MVPVVVLVVEVVSFHTLEDGVEISCVQLCLIVLSNVCSFKFRAVEVFGSYGLLTCVRSQDLELEYFLVCFVYVSTS